MIFKLQFNIFFTSLFMDYMCQENEDTIITSSTTELDIEAEYNKEITTAKPTKIQELYRRASMGDGYCARKPGSLSMCQPHENDVKMDSRKVFEKCELIHEIHDECKPYQCVYDDMGTSLKPGTYKKYMKDYVEANPMLKEAVDIAMANCTKGELKPQGLMKNCRAYDIHVCIRKEIVKNMPLSVWDPGCMQEREYYIKCEVCPITCKAQETWNQEPGTCFACADI